MPWCPEPSTAGETVGSAAGHNTQVGQCWQSTCGAAPLAAQSTGGTAGDGEQPCQAPCRGCRPGHSETAGRHFSSVIKFLEILKLMLWSSTCWTYCVFTQSWYLKKKDEEKNQKNRWRPPRFHFGEKKGNGCQEVLSAEFCFVACRQELISLSKMRTNYVYSSLAALPWWSSSARSCHRWPPDPVPLPHTAQPLTGWPGHQGRSRWLGRAFGTDWELDVSPWLSSTVSPRTAIHAGHHGRGPGELRTRAGAHWQGWDHNGGEGCSDAGRTLWLFLLFSFFPHALTTSRHDNVLFKENHPTPLPPYLPLQKQKRHEQKQHHHYRQNKPMSTCFLKHTKKGKIILIIFATVALFDNFVAWFLNDKPTTPHLCHAWIYACLPRVGCVVVV